MKSLNISFDTLDDGYYTTRGIAYADEEYLCTKYGRGDFDVLNKISKFYTDQTIQKIFSGEA